MHIVWINRHGSLVGGAEHYIKRTAEHFRARGIRSTLLYDPTLPTSSAMLDAFDRAFPLADVLAQVTDANADIVYMHQTRQADIANALVHSPAPVVEFFHDHWLFCLRVQKYTPFGRETCTKPVSAAACYPCLGFVRRDAESPGIKLRMVSDLQDEHAARRHFAGFVAGSAYMAEQALAHGFERHKIHVVPLYAEPPTISVESPIREADRLLYVGAILQYKGVDVLLNALSRTTTAARLDLVGEGSFMNEARVLVDKLGLSSRVTFLGKLGREQLGEVYRRATCLVLPSRTPESFGIVGAEALSYGLPAIASDIGGVLEWLEPGRTGLTFPINDPNGLAKAIDLLVSNPALANEMGKTAQRRYHECFRPEHHVARLLDVFEGMCRRASKNLDAQRIISKESNKLPL